MNRALFLIACPLLVACADERIEAVLADDARLVGWYVGTAERCGPDVRYPLGMPARYDDSSEGGPLYPAYIAGYTQGKNDTRPCVNGVPGR